MRKLKLYLHIGTAKTATTSIQEVLFQNRELLNSHGCHFLQCGGKRNNIAFTAYAANDGRFVAFFKSRRIATPKDIPDSVRYRRFIQI